MSDDDYDKGFGSGLQGHLSAPSTAAGWAGWMTGQALAHRQKQGSVGSIEWLVAPIVLAPVFAWLYPVTTAATLGTAYAVAAVMDAIGLHSHSAIAVGAIVAAAVAVCWTVGRRDQLWGLDRPYSRARHVARLVLLALVVNAAAMHAGAAHPEPGVGAFFRAMVTQPVSIVAMLGAVALFHWFARTSVLFRTYWHGKLVLWKFRPRSFPVGDVLPHATAAPARPAPLTLPPQLQRLEDASRAARARGREAAAAVPNAPVPDAAPSPAVQLRLGVRHVRLDAFTGEVTTASASTVRVRAVDGDERALDTGGADTAPLRGHRVSLVSGTVGRAEDGAYVAVHDHVTGETRWIAKGVNDVAGPPFYNALLIVLVFVVVANVMGSVRGESGAYLLVLLAVAAFAWILLRRRKVRSSVRAAMSAVPNG